MTDLSLRMIPDIHRWAMRVHHVFMFCVRIVLDYQRTSIKPPVSLCTGLADPEIGGRVERNMKSVQPCPFAIITAHDGSCGKVMFSQVSVGHSVHGLGGYIWSQVPSGNGYVQQVSTHLRPP